MGMCRIFYVTQGSLTVWPDQPGNGSTELTFEDNDQGLADFANWLCTAPARECRIVVDVIEEEFATDYIPRLRSRDRSNLLARRTGRKYPRTPYRLPLYFGDKDRNKDTATVVYCAISNHELLDPWLELILRYQVPLSLVTSVPLMAPRLLDCIHRTERAVLLLSQHQKTKLRQVFVDNGRVHSARLSESPAPGNEQYAAFVVNEVQRSRRYLERARLLSHSDQLDVVMLAEDTVSERVQAAADSNETTEFTFVQPHIASKRLGLSHPPPDHRHEHLFAAAARRRKPGPNYAVSGETRFFHLRRFRQAMFGSMFAVAALCSVLTGLLFSDALLLKIRAASIEKTVLQLEASYRREDNSLQPLQAGSQEMKLAVDTGSYLLRNRLPVPWVMQQLGLVLDDYPAMQVQEVMWTAVSESDERNRAAADYGKQAADDVPLQVTAISAVEAELQGRLLDFNGDLRQAFADIEQLVDDLRANTAFSFVSVIEYPLDASPDSTLSVAISRGRVLDEARFRLRLRYSVNTVQSAPEVSYGTT